MKTKILSWQGAQKTGTTMLSVLLCAQLAMPLSVQAQPVKGLVTEPAQKPLVAAGSMEPPNLMLIFDDSGSMASMSAPDAMESEIAFGMRYGSYHPMDTSNTSNIDYVKRIIATGINDPLAAMARSAQINKLYYDPAITYKPWAQANTDTLMPAYPANAVPIYAYPGAPVTWINLTGKNVPYTYTAGDRRQYCGWTGTKRATASCQTTTGTNTIPFTAAIYFTYTGPDANDPDFAGWSWANDNIRNVAYYTHVIIDDIGAGGITQYGDRGDCTKISDGVFQCSKAQEYQNFANWYVYYRGRTRAAIASLTHVFAKNYNMQYRLGWANLTGANRNIDGLGNFVYVKQGVRPFTGAFATQFYDWLYRIEYGTTNNGTPTVPALEEVGRYYSTTGNTGPWGAEPGSNNTTAHSACRSSSTILMTDGGWNATTSAVGDADGSNGSVITHANGVTTYQYLSAAPFKDVSAVSNTMADVAMYYWKRDLRPDLANMLPSTAKNPAFWQHMITHTVGFGVTGNLPRGTTQARIEAGTMLWPTTSLGSAGSGSEPGKTDDLWHAAVNGRGEFVSASNPKQLTDALSVIMENLGSATTAAPNKIASSDYLTSDSIAFVPSYQPTTWAGDFVSHKVTSSGALGAVRWSAAGLIAAMEQKERNIWVGTGGGNVSEFTWDNLPTSMKNILQSPSKDLGSDALVNFLRGDNTYAKGIWFRSRVNADRLGDIVNSRPVYVKESVNLGYSRSRAWFPSAIGYNAYVRDKANRFGTVFVGANDGMLHAFSTNTGEEVFAFIPKGLVNKLPNLAKLDYPNLHQYFMDGPLSLTDAALGSCTADTPDTAKACWRNILLGSAGAGGKSVFALDVTKAMNYSKTGTNIPSQDDISAVVKWDLTSAELPDLGYVMQPIQAGYVRLDAGVGTGKWIAVFGNGAYSANGKAILYVVDLKDGSLLTTITLSGGSNNGLMGVTLIKDSTQRVIGAYASDLKGNLWKIDLSHHSMPSWNATSNITKLFTTPGNRAITQAPTYAPFPADPNKSNMVVFGTGKFYDLTDLTDSGTDTLYGILDKGVETGPSATPIPVGSLLTRGFTKEINALGEPVFKGDDQIINWATQRGWRLPLTMGTAQRSLYTAQILGTDVVFNTTVPNSDGAGALDSCAPKGPTGIGVALNMFSGGAPSYLWDANGDGVIDAGDVGYIGFITGDGPGIIQVNDNLGNVGDPSSTFKCPEGTVYSVVDGIPGCAKAIDHSSWIQMF